jgi:hypothetical protein
MSERRTAGVAAVVAMSLWLHPGCSSGRSTEHVEPANHPRPEQPAEPTRTNGASMSGNNEPPVVEEQSAGTWTVRVDRALQDRHATGAVVTTTAPTADQPAPHWNLAAGQAWSQVASSSLEAGDADAAIEAARKGLEELGERYRPRRVKDDTALRIAAADERIAAGARSDGARMLIGILEQRMAMYAERNASTLRK